MTIRKYTFHIHGMHCNACVLMTESELGDIKNISHTKANLRNQTLEVVGDFGNKTEQEIAEELTVVLSPRGYTVSLEKTTVQKRWSEFQIAISIALLFALLFIGLQKIGLVNIVNTSEVGYGTAFIIGIIASLSTCMAVVGGLLLSMSATFAKEGDRVKPQIMFHAGRILSFFILGGVIGSIGSAFTLNTSATIILSLAIGLVMLVLGINLLEIFPWAKKVQFGMPRFIFKHAHGISKWNHRFTPLLVGIATFFLPCGFTQSMQLYTLSTGSFLVGGFTMLSFALGTFPVLALVGLSSFALKDSKQKGIFFKSAGLIVILFAVFNILNSLVIAGIIPPLFNF